EPPRVPARIMPAVSHATPPEPTLNKMALASLILSIFTFIVPLGVAAIVLGHISRAQIARSGGRQKGTGMAFAGLIIGYLQLALVSLVVVGMMSVGRVPREFGQGVIPAGCDSRSTRAWRSEQSEAGEDGPAPAERARSAANHSRQTEGLPGCTHWRGIRLPVV